MSLLPASKIETSKGSQEKIERNNGLLLCSISISHPIDFPLSLPYVGLQLQLQPKLFNSSSLAFKGCYSKNSTHLQIFYIFLQIVIVDHPKWSGGVRKKNLDTYIDGYIDRQIGRERPPKIISFGWLRGWLACLQSLKQDQTLLQSLLGPTNMLYMYLNFISRLHNYIT